MNDNSTNMKSIITQMRQFVLHHKWSSIGAALALVCLALAGVVMAQSGPTISTAFQPANPSRTWMEIGGVWDGSAEVTNSTGDTFKVTVNNPSGNADTMYSTRVRITLPTGFEYVSGSVSGATANVSGSMLTLTLSGTITPGNNKTVTYGLRATSAVSPGTANLGIQTIYKKTSGGSDVSFSSGQTVLVQAGDSVITKSPSQQTKAINETASWTVTVTNTGFGGLFDVVIDESTIAPSSASPLEITGFTQTSPALSATGTLASGMWTLPYLAPGESFTATIDAKVTACGDLTNIVRTTDRNESNPTLSTEESVFASVTLNLEQPLIELTVPDVTLDYVNTQHVTIPVKNTGFGTAKDLVLETNLPATNAVVSGLDTNVWDYSGGTFTLKNGGVVPNGATIPLEFDLSVPTGCLTGLGGTVVWNTSYKNLCDDEYETPSTTSRVLVPTNAPQIALEKTAPYNRLNVGQSGTYELELSVANPENFATDSSGNVVVTDVIPTGLINLSATASHGNAVLTGNSLEWTIPRATLLTQNTVTLTVAFTVNNDPCLGGTVLTNAAEAKVTTAKGCLLTSSSQVPILINNTSNPIVGEQFYDIDGGEFETGLPSADLTRDTHEGEFIPIKSSYKFSSGSGGTFTGSTYVDNYGGLTTQQLVTGSLEVSVNDGSYQSVPSLYSGNSVYSETGGKLTINLGFLSDASFAGTNNLAGQKFAFRYKTTVSDDDLNGDVTRHITQFGILTVDDNTDPNVCGTAKTFSQGDTYAISRAAADVSIELPSVIDRCEIFPVTLRVHNAGTYHARDVIATFLTNGNYRYPTGQNLTYGGVFNTGNITYSENGGNNPTFEYTGAALPGEGTITFNVQLKENAPLTPTPAHAHVNYNDYQTSGGPRQFQSQDAASAPVQVRSGKLSLVVSPQKVYIATKQVMWTVYVTNTGNGKAYGSTLSTALPAGLTPNRTLTDNQNGSYAVGGTGQSMSWALGDIIPGDMVTIKIVADIDDSAPTDIAGTDITAEWGCGSAKAQTDVENNPQVILPSGKLQVLHDTTRSFFTVCQDGEVEIYVRNTGLTHVYDVEVMENLQVGSSGIDYVPGSVQYSVNGGAFTAASSAYNPTGAGTASNPYKWTKAQIAELADLAMMSEGLGNPYEIRIKFKITADPSAIANPVLPQLTASATGKLANNGPYSSPGTAFELPAYRPDITVVKEGRNKTAGESTFAKTVYGGAGDEIEWQIRITNNSPTYANDANQDTTAKNVDITDIFAGGGPTTASIVATSGTTFSGTITSGTPLRVNNIPAGQTHVYVITETLGNTCDNGKNKVKVEWACPAKAGDKYHTPTDGEDEADLIMKASAPALAVTQATSNAGTSRTNGRVRMRMTLTNTGAPAKSLVASITVPSDLEIDASYAPTITTNGTTANAALSQDVNTVTLGGAAPNYTLTFNSNGWIRKGQTLTVEYYLIQSGNFDTTARGGTPLDPNSSDFNDPAVETVANSLDPVLPSGGANITKVDYESTCGAAGVQLSHSRTVDPLTPDLDITVNNFTQTVQKGQSYTFNFFYTITNNGDTGSVAENITFSLPYIGGTWDTTTITGPDGEPGTNSITLSQPINAGQSKIVTVQAKTLVVNTGYDLNLVGQVIGELKNQGGTVEGNYSFDRAAPRISDDVDVSGYVYLDVNHNAQRDPGEGGTGASPWANLWANLVDKNDAIVATKQVDPTSGKYTFTQVAGAGSPYKIVISNSATPTDTPMGMPAGYIGTEYPALVRNNVIVNNVNVYDQNFGLFYGSKLGGTVFKDTGNGGGTPNDGEKNGVETGIAGVTVKVTDNGGSTTYATAVTDPNGTYTVYIPGSAGNNPLRVVETNPSGYISTGAEPGNTSGTVTSPDIITFTNAIGQSYSGVNFGDVPKSTFIIDGNKSVAPGGVVDFPHTFTAGTAGDVEFSVVNTPTPASFSWTHTIYHDANGNGVLDPGETPISGPLPIAAGDIVHVIIRENAPANATNGAQDVLVITAKLTYANAPAITETLMRSDIATVGTQQELKLEKTVDKTNAESGEVLKYTIKYTNTSSDPMTELVIRDFVPGFTTFVSASYVTTPSGLTAGIVHPEPSPGGVGSIIWNFTGTLAPGAWGEVEFKVTVD